MTTRRLNVVDSSAWLEYVADGPNATFFAKAIEDTPLLVVPSICLVEVQRRLLSLASERIWLDVALVMQQGQIAPLDEELALFSGRTGLQHKLPLADSIVYATALKLVPPAISWTSVIAPIHPAQRRCSSLKYKEYYCVGAPCWVGASARYHWSNLWWAALGGVVWTQDADFAHLAHVEYRAKR